MEELGLGLLVIVGLLLVKDAGLPVPIPGDLIVIGLGVAAAEGRFVPMVALVAAIGASIAGGCVQFGLVRGPARRGLLALLGRFGVGEDRIDRQAERFRRGGPVAVAVARMTPGVRIVAVAAAALAALPFGKFLAGLAFGNAVFITGHFGLGMAFGIAATGILAGLFVPLVVLAAAGLAGYVAWRNIGARRRDAAGAGLAWTDASCPACLAIGSVVTR
jgi:membrane protein DedA with SNARE-associated domain